MANSLLKKSLLLTIAVLGLGSAAPEALAQDWGWERAPRWRPPPRVQPWWYDDYYGRPRFNRRYEDERYKPNRRDDDWDEQEQEAAPAPRPRNRQNGNGLETYDDNGKLTADGGGQPYIAPQAPPKVRFVEPYAANSIVIDSSGKKLYYVLGNGWAYAYPIGVGREGFSWTGKETISRIADWPDWHPPAEMRERKPELPEKMTGGIKNPLGAKALYLGTTLYRIHGTNDPKSIGRAESSGCFRMMNQHVLHLATLAQVGTEVSVVRSFARAPVVASVPKPPLQTVPRAPAPRAYEAPRPRPRIEWSPDPDPRAYDPDAWFGGR